MAVTETAVLPSGSEHMSKTPHKIRHRPQVHKGALGVFWWSACACGHARTFPTWRRALIDALIHSEEPGW